MSCNNNNLIESCIKSINEQISLLSNLPLSENSNIINKLSTKILNLILLENEMVNEKDEIKQEDSILNNEDIFWKVYRNCFIQQQIFKQIRLINNHYYTRIFEISENDLLDSSNGIEEINNYQYKDYLNRVELKLDQSITLKKITSKSIISTLQKLPENINSVSMNIYLLKKVENGTYVQGDEFEEIDGIVNITEPIVPSSITQLTLYDKFNYSFGLNSIPSTLKSLTFGKQWNHPLEIKTYSKSGNVTVLESIFPSFGLTSLKFGTHFSQNIYKSTLPQSLTKLEFDCFFNGLIEVGSIPNSVTHLTFGGSRYSLNLVEGLLPSGLKYLEFNDSNGPIDPGVLPSGLKHLKFSLFSLYNDEIQENSFPMGLETIEFGRSFNKSLEYLPTSITSLCLGDHFDQISTIYHLTSLVNLELKNDSLTFEPFWYLSPIEEKDNEEERYGLLSLETFIFPRGSILINSNSVPPNVKRIGYCTSDEQHQITSELENIKSMNMTKYITADFTLKPNQLSKHLEVIDGLDNRVPIGPDILSHMTNLKKVALSFSFAHCLLPNTFPSSLTELYIPSSYNHPIAKDALPMNLQYLSMKGHHQSLSGVHFPDSLKVLELGFDYNKEISSELLPPNIETLIVWGFRTTFKLPLPASLVSIFLSHTNVSILKENNLEFFNQHTSIIKVLPTNILGNAFKNKW